MHWNRYNMYLKSWQTWLFLSYIFIVLYLSAKPGDELGWFSQLWKYDKVVHFIEYMGVGFLLINAMKIQPLRQTHWKYAVCFLLIFPMFDEVLQYFTPTRIPDIFDVIVDIFGGLTGAYIRKYF